MLKWFRKKSLKDHLHQTKTVKVEGVIFELRKINIMDFLSGAQVMQAQYDIYRKEPDKITNTSFKKVKEHFRDLFLAAVVKPELSREKDCGEKIWVDELFNDWDMASQLFEEIIDFTYGKKKATFLDSRAADS